MKKNIKEVVWTPSDFVLFGDNSGCKSNCKKTMRILLINSYLVKGPKAQRGINNIIVTMVYFQHKQVVSY